MLTERIRSVLLFPKHGWGFVKMNKKREAQTLFFTIPTTHFKFKVGFFVLKFPE